MEKAFDSYFFKVHMQIKVYYLYLTQVLSVFSELIISMDMRLLSLYLSLLSLLSIYFNLA